jgi:DNA-binding Xre family transcriptional regulator
MAGNGGYVFIDRRRLDRELTRRGLTGAKLAELADIPQETFSRIRTGKGARMATFMRICEALAKVPVVEVAEAIALLPDDGDVTSRIAASPASVPVRAAGHPPTGSRQGTAGSEAQRPVQLRKRPDLTQALHATEGRTSATSR